MKKLEKKTPSPLIVALDVDTFAQARTLIDALGDTVDIFKVGSQLFTSCGPVVVRYILARGKEVFLDLKFHDIPNTVAHAVAAAVRLGVAVTDPLSSEGHPVSTDTQGLFMCTVHTVGGKEMLERAVEAARATAHEFGVPPPLLVGITVLTSEQQTVDIEKTVLARARLAKECGLDGVVSSSQEAAAIRAAMGPDFVIVTPGIRPKGSSAGDQKRIMTPADAIKNGSSFLVVGRPIVEAREPAVVARDIQSDIAALTKK